MKKRRKSSIKIVLIILCVALLLLVAGCVATGIALWRFADRGGFIVDWKEGKDGTISKDIMYDSRTGHSFDLYQPGKMEAGQHYPVILFIHGGSWTGGKKEDMDYACKYFAKNGCITATMTYSLISDKHPEINLNTVLDEIGQCIGKLGKELEGMGFPADKIAIGGVSAGGHLSMLYAYSRADASPIPIAFVIDKVGPSTFSEEAWGKEMAFGLTQYGAGAKLTEQDFESDSWKALADSLSPVHFINPKSAPTILAYGGKDTLVKPIHRDSLIEALQKNGVPYTSIDYPKSNHGMWDDPECVPVLRDTILQYCGKYMYPPASDVSGENATH